MKVLFICTHNRCRSILAEAITNHLSKGAIKARSAGSQPEGEVHPLTLKYLKQHGYPTEGLRSKSWDECESWQPDVVITVCDSAAGEVCPVWFSDCLKVHWGLPDPSKAGVDNEETERAFSAVIGELEKRIKKVLQSDLTGISEDSFN